MPGPGTAAAATDPRGRLIPAGKVGTILYTQRDADGRAGTGTPQMGYVGHPACRAPRTPVLLSRCPAASSRCSSSSRRWASSRSSSPASGQNEPTRADRAEPGSLTTNPNNLYLNRAAYLDYIRTLRGFLDNTGLEAIGNHGYIPASWPGPGSPSTGGPRPGR